MSDCGGLAKPARHNPESIKLRNADVKRPLLIRCTKCSYVT
jgi:hypothetical protein